MKDTKGVQWRLCSWSWFCRDNQCYLFFSFPGSSYIYIQIQIQYVHFPPSTFSHRIVFKTQMKTFSTHWPSPWIFLLAIDLRLFPISNELPFVFFTVGWYLCLDVATINDSVYFHSVPPTPWVIKLSDFVVIVAENWDLGQFLIFISSMCGVEKLFIWLRAMFLFLVFGFLWTDGSYLLSIYMNQSFSY